MGYIVRSIGALAALAIVCAGGLAPRAASAAPVTFSSTVTIASPPLSSPGNPVQLIFTFPALLINVQSITISGHFGTGSGAWNYYDKFAFSTGPTGPYGPSYYEDTLSNSGVMRSFLISLYPAPTGAQQTTPNVHTIYPTGGTAVFKDALLTQLASSTTITLYFQPQPSQIYLSPSQFRVLDATLTAVGDDPPAPSSPTTVAHAPIPAGALLFASGAIIVWWSGRTRRRKDGTAG
jgi:hypothetical protein